MDPDDTKWPLEDQWVAEKGQGGHQSGPKGEPNGSRGGQEGASWDPKWPQGSPWGSQDAPKMTPGRPQGGRRGPNWHKMEPKGVERSEKVRHAKVFKKTIVFYIKNEGMDLPVGTLRGHFWSLRVILGDIGAVRGEHWLMGGPCGINMVNLESSWRLLSRC